MKGVGGVCGVACDVAVRRSPRSPFRPLAGSPAHTRAHPHTRTHAQNLRQVTASSAQIAAVLKDTLSLSKVAAGKMRLQEEPLLVREQILVHTRDALSRTAKAETPATPLQAPPCTHPLTHSLNDRPTHPPHSAGRSGAGHRL